MILSEIYIYPIKSCGGIQLESSRLTPSGLEFDRRFMLTSRDGMFMTQRQHRQMVFLKTDIKNEKLLVWHKDKKEDVLIIPSRAEQFSKQQEVEIWDEKWIGSVMPEQINEWFSNKLNSDCQLVYMKEGSLRRMKPKYSSSRESVSFADAAPLLVIGQSSMDDLNSRLDESITVNRFRPNLVFKSGESFQEDNWNAFRISGHPFRVTHRCVRCSVPNINQNSGQIEKEPNRTLATFRKINSEIFFGVNAVWDGLNSQEEYKIHLGDAITLD